MRRGVALANAEAAREEVAKVDDLRSLKLDWPIRFKINETPLGHLARVDVLSDASLDLRHPALAVFSKSLFRRDIFLLT